MSDDPSDRLKAKLDARTQPRLTERHIESKISSIKYLRDDQLTICIITLKNGFKVVGHTAPANPKNFNEEIGKHFALKDAKDKIWPLEGYMLKEQLAEKKE